MTFALTNAILPYASKIADMGVPKVFKEDKVILSGLNIYKGEDERLLDQMTVQEARRYFDEGHFHPGSMGSKVETTIEFTSETGNPTVITLPETMMNVLERKTGTWIVV